MCLCWGTWHWGIDLSLSSTHLQIYLFVFLCLLSFLPLGYFYLFFFFSQKNSRENLGSLTSSSSLFFMRKFLGFFLIKFTCCALQIFDGFWLSYWALLWSVLASLPGLFSHAFLLLAYVDAQGKYFILEIVEVRWGYFLFYFWNGICEFVFI